MTDSPGRRLLRAFLLGLAAWACSACSSIRLLADPARGFEGAGPRTLALAFDRLAVEPYVDADSAPPALAVEGATGVRLAIVYVPLRAYNGTDAPWTLSLEDFDVTRIDHPDTELPPQTTDPTAGTSIAIVAPHGQAALSLPLRLPASILDEPQGRYRLRCRSVTGGTATTILQRDLVLDELEPFGQGIYVIGVGALILAVGVML